MNITNVKIYPINREGTKLKGIAVVTLEHVFVVRDLRIIMGNDGLFVAMPSTKLKSGDYRDICHPVSIDFHNKMTSQIIEEYNKILL